MDIKLQKSGIDIEIKAKCMNHIFIKKILAGKKAKKIGKFKMRDIYFNVKYGRLKAIVRKEREIYILGNTRFHLDKIQGLGNFIEIEARGEKEKEIKRLREQIKEYIKLLRIDKKTLVANSSSDLVLAKNLHKRPK